MVRPDRLPEGESGPSGEAPSHCPAQENGSHEPDADGPRRAAKTIRLRDKEHQTPFEAAMPLVRPRTARPRIQITMFPRRGLKSPYVMVHLTIYGRDRTCFAPSACTRTSGRESRG
jgi:hypothetical protein